MPITTLDPTTALIVIDLQKGIVARPTAEPAGEIVARAAALATAFRRHRLPVVLVNVDSLPPGRTEQSGAPTQFPAGFADLVPELGRQPGDHAVTKHGWGAFIGTDLDALLKRLGVTQVVVAGISTSIGVESTARQAYQLGYHVTLATDAMTDTSAEAQANSLARIFPRLGERGTTRQIIDWLDHSA